MATIAEGRGAGKGWTVPFSGPCRLWVIFDYVDGVGVEAHFRFAPKADL
jgi:hypothetical protein